MKRVFNLELLSPVFILATMSLAILLSLEKSLFQNQLFFVLVGILVFIIFSFLDYRVFKNIGLPIFFFSVILLFLLLLVGTETRGAVRWLALASFRIQISEILKPFLIAGFVSFLASHEKKISFPDFIRSLFLIGAVALPVFLQPDFGNTLIYIFVALLLLIFYGVPLWYFGLVGGPLLVFSPFVWQLLHEYQKQRILTFLNPEGDPLGSSYNLIQAVIAVGGGKLFGRGLGHGTQSQLQFLPERHTDFIFATISENFGFIGAILVLAAFTLLLIKIYKIIKETTDPFGALFSVGALALIFLQVFINIGGNIGILPITGITLPFVSYGGSSLLSMFTLLGIVNSIFLSRRKPPQTLEIR